MKLNLGCGKRYEQGYINIDPYDKTVADENFLAKQLPYNSNSVELIKAYQLIEHLGLIGSLYSLSEWFRVLKPNGTLIIETPFVEESFRRYLNGDIETKKQILSWIYGVESKGMTHRLCFPEKLLVDILKKTGFSSIKKEFLEREKNNPTLRVECVKPESFRYFQIISYYRKKLVQEKIVQTDQYTLSLEQENLIEYFTKKLKQLIINSNTNIVDEIVIKGSIKSPKMTKVFFEVCIAENIIQKNKFKKHAKLLDFLIRIDFPSVMITFIKESPVKAGTQKKTVDSVKNLVVQSIKNFIMDKREDSSVKETLVHISSRSSKNPYNFFSQEILEHIAADSGFKSIKEFSLGNFNKAYEMMNEALKLDRNHILYYWNLGRLKTLIDGPISSKRYYRDTLELIQKASFEQKELIIKKLRKEMKTPSDKKYHMPISDVIQCILF